jgi:hypothetical protein
MFAAWLGIGLAPTYGASQSRARDRARGRYFLYFLDSVLLLDPNILGYIY